MSGEKAPGDTDTVAAKAPSAGPECEETNEEERRGGGQAVGEQTKEDHGFLDKEADRRGGGGGGGCGRWDPNFLREELREICLQQLEIPVGFLTPSALFLGGFPLVSCGFVRLDALCPLAWTVSALRIRKQCSPL